MLFKKKEATYFFRIQIGFNKDVDRNRQVLFPTTIAFLSIPF